MIGATIQKDVWLLLRDRGRLLMLFAMPIVFIVVFGSMFGSGRGKGEPRAIAIWHAAGDARGEAIERVLAATPGFAPRPLASADAVRDAVAHDDSPAGLIVPATGPIEQHAKIARVESRQANLETAFLALTGRALRDHA